MRTVRNIITLWPSASEMARDLGLKRESHGTVMKTRGSIPVWHWARLIQAAEKRGIEGISYEVLADAHARHADETEHTSAPDNSAPSKVRAS